MRGRCQMSHLAHSAALTLFQCAAQPGDVRGAAATCPTPHTQLPLRFSHPAALPGDECGTAIRVPVGGWRQGKAPSGLFDWRLLRFHLLVLFYSLGPQYEYLWADGVKARPHLSCSTGACCYSICWGRCTGTFGRMA